jgi:Tfp pilus assembly protein PilX
MRKIHAMILLTLLALPAFSQIQMQQRINLQNLLAERAKNFSEYTSSIQKRSGIFGNKTRHDLAKSNEVLIQIVTLDNNIMDALNRALDYKTFQKTTDNFNSRDCELRLKQSMLVTDTLTKQLSILEKKIKSSGSSASGYKFLFYIFSALSTALLIIIMRKKNNISA